jgi:cytochrome c2
MSGVIYLDSKINHKITQMNIVTLNFSLKRLLPSLTLFLVFSLNLMGQEGDPANGKKLFNTNCAACHKLDIKLIDPPLKGISEKRTNEWLQAWIKDNNALRASGDQDAIDIFEE